MRCLILSLGICCAILSEVKAQDVNQLLLKVKEKLSIVKDYQAEGKLKLDVPFLQVPESKITIYYKQPDKFRIRQEKGISLIPKGGISVNLSTLFAEGIYTAVDAGESTQNKLRLRVVKLLPLEETSDVVLSTLYIDALDLVRKVTTTTRENGTYEIEFFYGKYSNWALPDEVIFSFNTKDYKLPKGVTFDYDEGQKTVEEKPKSSIGKVKITYSRYLINKGVSDDQFTSK